jgi:hypothetical protein
MRRPNLFFVGHPRSGSGLLDSFLAGHPSIFMARKELHYFGSDLVYHDPPRSLENYLDHFRRCPADATWVGEASTWLLISERAAAEVAAFTRGNAKIILQLREPLSWLQSLHAHLLFTGDEDLADLGEALEAEADRAAGKRLPPWSIPRCATAYRGHLNYSAQVQRWFDHFGRDRVKVLLLDDTRADPRRTFQDILAFLELPSEFPGMDGVLDASARSRNANRTVWSRRVRNFVNRPENRRVLEGVDRAPFPGVGFAIRAGRRLNIRYQERAPDPGAWKAGLQPHISEEISKLEDLLGRDLSMWRA